MIHEIRNYHYEPKLMKEYKEWATKLALPYIRKNMDLVGFWVNVDEAPSDRWQAAGRARFGHGDLDHSLG